jgi:hypothetical protein
LPLVPVFAQGRVVGDRLTATIARDTEGDQELASTRQQAAVAIRLAEQRSVQEQLFRTENRPSDV